MIAERDYREAVALADAVDFSVLQTGTMFDLAKFYVMTGRDALAVPILEQTAERARANPPQSNTRLLALIEFVQRVATRLGRYGRAALCQRRPGRWGGPRAEGQRDYVTALFAVANASIDAGQADVAAAVLAQITAMLPKAVSATIRATPT